ncbi:hypothetical protein QP110_04530 [Aerococcus sp. UMB10185]|uniref:hypothetical protein n=1 Tax=Aerococcus sp. UMB10185 TaxID=3046357 RepID=UPI00254AF172|nr:hypothetical protein [Aerococcus sp. UMB10185]MDK6233526.1 hypothetical protein [Aerococcus sp. UMB10185]
MNKTKIYQLLNQTKMNLSDYPDEQLSTQQKDRLYAQFQASVVQEKTKSYRRPLILGLVLAIALLTLTPWGQQASASVKSLIDTTHFTLSASAGGMDEKTFPVGQTIQMGDHQVKLADALLDENSVTASFLVESPEALSPQDFYDFVGMAIAVNGKTTRINSAAGSARLLDNGIYQTTMTYSFDEPVELQTNNQIYLQISGLMKNAKEVISMNDAAFDLSRRPEDLNGGSRYINPNKGAPAKQDAVNIQAVKLHPLKTQIQAQIPEADAKDAMIEADLILPDGRRLTLTGASEMKASATPGLVDFQAANFDFSGDARSKETYQDLIKQDAIQVELFKIPLPEESGRIARDQRTSLGEPVTVELDGGRQ